MVTLLIQFKLHFSYLTIKQESQELERFLLDKCTKNLPLYFLVY